MANAMTHVTLGGGCDQRCAVCDCHDGASPADAQGVPFAVRGGGGRLVLRGNAPSSPYFARVLETAAGARWDEVWLRTPGDRFVSLDAAVDLHARGVRGVIVPLFSSVSAVHDRVAGRPGALVDALRAMRSLSAAGVSVSVEAPLLPVKLQDLTAVLELAHRAVPSLAGARFYVPTRAVPAVIAPPRWGDVRASLRAAIAWCEARKVPVALHEFDGVPLCALGHDEDLQRVYRINPTRKVSRRSGSALGAACAGCAVRDHCLGVTDAYRAAHGESDLVPFGVKPRRLFEQRTTPRREWTDAQRRSASLVLNRVLRPTVHCNQDCPFCSANETTENVFKRPEEMYRRIARMARSGVRHISFSGGEPALSKDLVHYVRTASRLGVKDVELVTNGALLDTREKVRPLIEAGLTKAFVSLHAHDEALSRRATAKIGDFDKTVRCIDEMLAGGVMVSVNHVITAVNYPYLPRFADFISARWKGAVAISFAFVTPQYRALENLALVPRISEVIPYLRRALGLLVARESPFIVGSRQGIPPCFLGEFTAWSDFVDMAPQAHADDAPQKVRGPRCDQCRFSPQCVGLWRPYAARFGFDELVPVPGERLTAEEATQIESYRAPKNFGEVHPALRLPLQEDPPLPAEPPLPRSPRRLPLVAPSRALRVVLLGSGSHAQRLARALAQVPGMSLVGVASPHLLERDPGVFSGVAREADAGGAARRGEARRGGDRVGDAGPPRPRGAVRRARDPVPGGEAPGVHRRAGRGDGGDGGPRGGDARARDGVLARGAGVEGRARGLRAGAPRAGHEALRERRGGGAVDVVPRRAVPGDLSRGVPARRGDRDLRARGAAGGRPGRVAARDRARHAARAGGRGGRGAARLHRDERLRRARGLRRARQAPRVGARGGEREPRARHPVGGSHHVHRARERR